MDDIARMCDRVRDANPKVGSFMLVWFDGDVEKAFGDLASDNSEFATWFREQVKDVTGVDLAAPLPGPLPDVLVNWHS